jgi:hypothetical protein
VPFEESCQAIINGARCGWPAVAVEHSVHLCASCYHRVCIAKVVAFARKMAGRRRKAGRPNPNQKKRKEK